jgi:nucleoside-diphosphate-sugar epimerase
MKFFLTGITGFIGSHFYRRLLAEGHQVSAQVRNPTRAAELAAEGVEVVRGDLSLFRDAALQLPEADVVVHLAGVIAAESLDRYEAINYGAVVDLVECLHRQRWRPKRLLFASSLAAVGPNDSEAPHTEDTPCRPTEPYGIAKLRAEQYLGAHAKFPVTCFRPSLVLGPGDGATLSLYRMASTGFGFKAAGFDQLLSLVDVDDVVAAMMAMSRQRDENPHTYFISNDPPVATSALFHAIGRALGRSRVRVISIPKPILRAASRVMTGLSQVFGFTNQLDAKQCELITAPAFVCSAQRLRAETGWSPAVSLEASLAKAVEGYRARGQL